MQHLIIYFCNMVNKGFIKWSKYTLVMVFLVIVAGAIVRMTQSGMGCPDWPKCFGKWIPPTNASELPPDFEKYLKQQDIDHSFNVFHTWTEYINRLLGALLGLFLLAQFAWSIKFWRSKKFITLLCLGNLLLTGFQGWLGKRVVDANLAGVKITTHLVVALLIAAIAMAIVFIASQKPRVKQPQLFWLATIALLLLTLQIVLGTQVREQVDHISKFLNYQGRELWIDQLGNSFYIHRSFSLLVTAAVFFFVFKCIKNKIVLFSNKLAIACIVAEMALGIIMAYAHVPAFAQPLHLLFSSILFVALFYSLLSLKRK